MQSSLNVISKNQNIEYLLNSSKKILTKYNENTYEVQNLGYLLQLDNQKISSGLNDIYKNIPESYKSLRQESVKATYISDDFPTKMDAINKARLDSLEKIKKIYGILIESKSPVLGMLNKICNFIDANKHEEFNVNKDTMMRVINTRDSLRSVAKEILQHENLLGNIFECSRWVAIPDYTEAFMKPARLTHRGIGPYLPERLKAYIGIKAYYHSIKTDEVNDFDLMNQFKDLKKLKLNTKSDVETFSNKYCDLHDMFLKRVMNDSVLQFKVEMLQNQLFSDYSKGCCLAPSKKKKTLLKEMINDLSNLEILIEKDKNNFATGKKALEAYKLEVYKSLSAPKKQQSLNNMGGKEQVSRTPLLGL